MQGLERLLTVEDVVELFRLKKSYLYALTSENRIPHYKIGGFVRFRQSELEAWLTGKAQGNGRNINVREREARHVRA